ncbi:amidase domain-containing protein [Metabacillus indicus]|uniref:amidase domain-containing protein n=1 Tax=Metabacillus indicus TaxID=246786 RepID=UPI002490D6B6|nr:amidase domain-containing protein [Metabacillus indicus]
MKKELAAAVKSKLEMLVNSRSARDLHLIEDSETLLRKKQILKDREVELLKGRADVQVLQVENVTAEEMHVTYKCHYKYFHNDRKSFYMEEKMEDRMAIFQNGMIVSDDKIEVNREDETDENREDESDERVPFRYDRLAAVQYAERWWNTHNPKYKNFDVNCTNYVSQCLRAGGAPMRGYPGRSAGWWMQNSNWSYSWTVAHSLTMHLGHSKTGLRASRVYKPEALMPGDVICYDFQGDGRFDHTTIVVSKDKSNMPLVNANTYNSRMRYWDYEDSTAYTPNIAYRFYHIEDDAGSKKQ